jgi:hypothetical protein
MYKLLKNARTNEVFGALKENNDGTCTSFPFVLDNTDYQEYLKWVAAGNTPEPADE